MNDFVSVVLKESFSEPLIDVLLSMPPASNINKTLELELIEILTRHSYQRKGNVVAIKYFLMRQKCKRSSPSLVSNVKRVDTN